MCIPEEMVELSSRLVELPVVKLTGADYKRILTLCLCFRHHHSMICCC